MKILTKLVLAFLLMALLLGFVGYTSFKNVTAAYSAFSLANEQNVPMIESLNEMKLSALNLFSATSEIMLYSMKNESIAKEVEEREMHEINESRERFEEALKSYGLLVERYFPNETEHYENMQKSWTAFVARSDAVLAFRGSGQTNAAFEAQKRLEESKENLLGAIDAALAHESMELDERHEGIKETLDSSLKRILLSIWIFAALSAIGIFISYSISKSAAKLKDAAGKMGKGDLDAKADVSSKDEMGDLASTLNLMAGDLKKSRDETSEKAKEAEASKKELEEKVRELQEGKSAILNMMEDAEELNRELIGTQEKLKENVKELKETDVKKNEFMSIAAHELKTPMTSIHGFSQLLQNPEVAGDPEKRDKYLKIMDKETTRLAKLVNDVLDLSRIDLNAMKFDISEVDVSQIIDTIKTEMSVQMKAKGLDSEYDVAKDIPKINTDRERLTQVLMNLINNSVKYTQKGKITVKIFNECDSAHFLVKDTGIGIAKKNQGKIFSRFYQVDSSYTRSAGGVGLGLSLCKEFVERLGGKIWFASEIGRGTEFHFTLPLKTEPIKKDEKNKK